MKNWFKQQILHIQKAAIYSWQGLKFAYHSEIAFRLEIIGAIIFIPLGLYLGHNVIQKLLLVGSVLFILIIELINSAIEKVVDRISKDLHPLSGQAKDIASAAVLLAIINFIIVWVVVICNL